MDCTNPMNIVWLGRTMPSSTPKVAESPCPHPDPQLTSSGFSLVILAAMTWPLGTGGLEGLWKQMGVSPQGLSPYSTRMSFILCKGMPIAICRRDKGLSCQGHTDRESEWEFPAGKQS